MNNPAKGDLGKQAFAGKSLSEKRARQVTAILWDDEVRKIREEYTASWQQKKFTTGRYVMPVEYRVFGEKPADGRSLYISMHGGGNTAPAVNDQQWRNQVRLYEPAEGVYIAPRAAVDDWNMWFQPHVDSLFDQMIHATMVLMDVNPDKVYLLGYSAGGDGAYRLAPRLADRWGAVSMMAGHPGDVSPVNLRNIGFSLWMGGNDGAYNRNKEAAVFGAKLDSLHRADPAGYRHEVHILPGKGHWMDRADTVAVPWMAKFLRNPLPDRVVWRQDDTPRESLYWLSVPLAEAKKGAQAVVWREGNTFTIEENTYPTLLIGLNDGMIDFSRPVVIRAGDKEIFRGKVKRNTAAIHHSIAVRRDPRLIFSAYLTVTGSEKVIQER